jgi:hypothetical protein
MVEVEVVLVLVEDFVDDLMDDLGVVVVEEESARRTRVDVDVLGSGEKTLCMSQSGSQTSRMAARGNLGSTDECR